MHYTLHLTNNCNMECRYCYVDRKNILNMDKKIIEKAVDLATENKNRSTGIVFFGGEPLLNKELIYYTIEYCKYKNKFESSRFHYKITTNGILLDNDFIKFSLKENIFIALSFDGVKKAHDYHRVDLNYNGTFDIIDKKADMLLSKRPYSPVMLLTTPETVSYYYDSIKYLFKKGFRYLICSLNYAGNWDSESLSELKHQYELLGEFYIEKILEEEKFYFSPFEVKISSHINSRTYCTERCELGKKQISIGPDGLLYPCVQFVGDDKYSIGNVNDGINEKRRQELYCINEYDKDECNDCIFIRRCNHYCGCLNKQVTGRIDRVAPSLCAHERIVIPIADKIAAKLFKKKSPMFIQKHYNDMFPLISLIEDMTFKI